jgi:hypothetical protein
MYVGHFTPNSRYIRLELLDAEAAPNAPASALDFEATWLVGESFVGGTLREDWADVAPVATMVQVLVKRLTSVVGVKPGATATAPLPPDTTGSPGGVAVPNTATVALTGGAEKEKDTSASAADASSPISYCFFSVDVASATTAGTSANGTAVPAVSSGGGKPSDGGSRVQMTSAIPIDPSADVFPNVDQVFAFVLPGVATNEAKVTLTYSKTGKVSSDQVVDKKTGSSTGVLKLNGSDGEMQVLKLRGGEVAHVMVKRTPLTPSIGPPPKPHGLKAGGDKDDSSTSGASTRSKGSGSHGKRHHHGSRFSFLSALSCASDSAGGANGVVEPENRRVRATENGGENGTHAMAASALTGMERQQGKLEADP